MKVLVIGDSFGQLYDDTTWLMQLAVKHNWTVTNYSVGGSGPLYLIHKFLFLHDNKEIENFDLIIFLWSEPFRHFNPGDPRFCEFGDTDPQISTTKKKLHYKTIVEQIKRCFWNDRFFAYNHIGNCIWFDQFINEKYSTHKFWHFHCFPYYDEGKEHFEYAGDLNNQKHYHYFKHGVNISPSLAYFSVNDNFKSKKQMKKIFANDIRPGHLSQEKHDFLYNRLCMLVEKDYVNGSEFLLDNGANKIELGPYSIDTRKKHD